MDVLFDNIDRPSPRDHRVPLGVVRPFTVRVSAALVGGEAKVGDSGTALRRSDFGVTTHITDKDYLVDHGFSSPRGRA
jgi:hypothetical protein